MNCYKQGETRLMLTTVPFFKELVVSSFECENCGFKNNEVQTAGKIQDFGCIISLKLTDPKDIQRDIVKSEYAVISIIFIKKYLNYNLKFQPAKKAQ